MTKYATPNETIQDQLWHDINANAPIVALSDAWAVQHGLSTAGQSSQDELEEFAKRHTVCYKRPEVPEEGPVSKLERFKHFPLDSGRVVTDDYTPIEELMIGLPEESIELE
ncbi:hypothetical protein PG987_012375 [Apiospora arundinis]